jgi:hypothetical protein
VRCETGRTSGKRKKNASQPLVSHKKEKMTTAEKKPEKDHLSLSSLLALPSSSLSSLLPSFPASRTVGVT